MFITFEGIDGSGKTTQIKMLKEYLDRYIDTGSIIFTKEPFSEDLSEYLKNNDLSKREQERSFISDRIIHVQKIIKPALKDGKIVICDRYEDSTRAYQGTVFKEYPYSIPIPDITLLLDIDSDIAITRINTRNKIDSIEKKGLIMPRENYLLLQRTYPERIKLIDANKNRNIIFSEIVEILRDAGVF